MRNNYSLMLQHAISNSGKSLGAIAAELQQYGFKTHKGYLSKLQNGKLPPAGDGLNQAMAEILNLDAIELKAAAYREKIPPDVLEKIQLFPKASSA